MSNPTVFISYSHLDEEWKDRLVRHLAVSQKQGHLELWHDQLIGAGEDWELRIQAAMNAASIAILLVSANLLTSDFILREEVTHLLQRRASEGLRIVPVVIKPCDWGAVDWLRRMNLRPKEGKPLSGGNDHEIDLALAEIASEIRELLERTAPPVTLTYVPLNPDEISISRLPRLLTPHLFGREAELQLLDKAWADPHTNIAAFVAWGGVGKSALVSHWLMRLEQENYRGAERVYAWSFYSQGTSDHAATADYFINDALLWFGGDALADQLATATPWEKGERLARLVRQTRTLLILDGLEPVQHPPGQQEGRLKEQSLQALLRELAAHQPGLCIISTREAIGDLTQYEGHTVVRHDLTNLSPQAGARLLREMKVNGMNSELEMAAREYVGHSLALTLLGSYLGDVYAGDVRYRHEIESLEEDVRHGWQVRRMMRAYERWLGERQELAMLDVLRLLGVFDRPADTALVAALRAAPAIPGLTESITGPDDNKWRRTVSALRRIRLLTEAPDQSPDTLDAHPLVREYFRTQLKAERLDAWHEANNRLYEHLKRTTKEFPESFDEMAQLYAAVTHGCEAGRYRNVFIQVYWRRVLRGKEEYSIKKLGAFGADLAALAGFFVTPWSQPVSSLNKLYQGALLNAVGIRLQALGRLKDAIVPMQKSVDTAISQLTWENAAKNAKILSELYLTLGDIPRALTWSEQSMNWADRSGDLYARMISRTAHAHALHQVGSLKEADANFREAEALQRNYLPQFPHLFSFRGFQYCELLLRIGKFREVRNRATQSLEIAENNLGFGLLDVALGKLLLGRALLSQLKGKDARTSTQAADLLHCAVGELRKAEYQEELVRGLLARAELHRLTNNYAFASDDLDEVFAIVTRGEMRLHQADCHLESARLALAICDHASARKAWETAKAMIEEMGYHRRDGEVKEIEAKLNAN